MTARASKKGKKWLYLGLGFTGISVITAAIIMIVAFDVDLTGSTMLFLYILLGCLGLLALAFAVHDWMKKL